MASNQWESTSGHNMSRTKAHAIDSMPFDSNNQVKIDGVPTRISKEAIEKILDETFSRTSRIMKIASGICTIKGLNEIGTIEIDQATQMHDEGINKFLPEESW